MSKGKCLLMGSESLTEEEELLRGELILWCQERFDNGARPVALQAAFTIMSDVMVNPDEYGFRLRYNTGGYKRK